MPICANKKKLIQNQSWVNSFTRSEMTSQRPKLLAKGWLTGLTPCQPTVALGTGTLGAATTASILHERNSFAPFPKSTLLLLLQQSNKRVYICVAPLPNINEPELLFPSTGECCSHNVLS